MGDPMPEEDSQDSPPDIGDGGMAALAAMWSTILRPIAEMVAGYKRYCVEMGFSDTTAEAFAIQAHSLIIQRMAAS